MFRSIAAALIAASLVGCTVIRPVRHPADYIQAKHPHRVLVTRSDDSIVTLVHPTITADSIVGFDGTRDVRLPLTDLKTVEVRCFDGEGTGLIVGAAALTTTLVWVTTHRDHSSIPQCHLCPDDPTICCG